MDIKIKLFVNGMQVDMYNVYGARVDAEPGTYNQLPDGLPSEVLAAVDALKFKAYRNYGYPATLLVEVANTKEDLQYANQ